MGQEWVRVAILRRVAWKVLSEKMERTLWLIWGISAVGRGTSQGKSFEVRSCLGWQRGGQMGWSGVYVAGSARSSGQRWLGSGDLRYRP